MKKILFLGIVLALALSFCGTALAQDTTNVTAQDLGIKDQKLLPDSPFYFLKEWRRNLALTFTFNKVRKAELENIISNEKIAELQKLAEKKGVSAEAVKGAIERYKQSVENLKTATDKIKDSASNPSVQKFMDKFGQQQVLQEKILEKLQTKVPEKVFDRIKEARERHLQRFKNVMDKVTQKEGQKFCTMEYAPVCGSDGKTYSNKCVAKNAGIETFTDGECPAEAKTCQADSDCPAIYCIKAPCPVNKCVENKCKLVETETPAP